MRARWIEQREQAIAARVLLLPLRPAAAGYALGARAHRMLYRRRWLAPRRLACRVVSVGNLVVGGSGKTPTAAWIAAGLRKRGHRVVLATRGYGRARLDAVTVVSDGQRLHAPPELAGDEPLVLAAHAPGVPVLVGPDRGVVGLRAVGAFDCDVLVLDDGFQHHRLASDADVVVFDGGFGLGNGHVLPRGPLREPTAALAHAHAIGVVDGPLPEADSATVAHRAPKAFRFEARRRPVALRTLAGDVQASPRMLKGMEVGLVTALARPDGLRGLVTSLGARVVAERTFRDHHRYRSRDFVGLSRLAAVWITTEKDAVKILPSWQRGTDVRVLAIELAVAEAEALLDWLESRL